MSTDKITDEQADRMLKAMFNPKPNNKTLAVIIHDAEEKDFPATMPVLRMSRVNNLIHFSVCKETESATGYAYEHIYQMAFDTETFMNSLLAIISDNQENV